MVSLSLRRPDDFHLHLRDLTALATTVPHAARQCARALVMPNLPEPIRSVAEAREYRERILAALPPVLTFEPLMTLYLTGETPKDSVAAAQASGFVKAFKLYPQGATTNSAYGLPKIEAGYKVFEEMEKRGMILCIHGEVTNPEVDIFDREKVFIETRLAPLRDRFPGLKIVLEHLTTKEGVEFIKASGPNLAASLTAHHLWLNRNDLLVGGIRPHHYCLPVAKREEHRRALVEAAISGNPKFFMGSDSAPHPKLAKEAACGCAGVYTGRDLMAFYATAFEKVNALDRLEDFCSSFGAQFYGLAPNDGQITLVKKSHQVPTQLPYAQGQLIPFCAGDSLNWQLQ
ncbi:MAG: dihydroorotase [Candidatus Lambdaproteobacteria bacterium RIFOXYD2_FULL_50_16]|uniref:Dihydroorotase n=1 Tax=Candidatus Lambdaproteobacteria bacterium RIFOXYD2_FULL_50_16 TaxID=1817772 RepID=A0A1F6GGP4_9PROT|nr:MAG: dihydroorotase [Candidatus Lambdaproteobacteria bacterium RIFOXYD2_FULL_50_16]